MTRTLRLALVVVTVLALSAPSASAVRRTHHGDPIRAFAKYKHFRATAHASGFVSNFATTWPCIETTSERPPVISANAPQVKVIYAYPTDIGGDQFASYATLIQADAQAVRSRVGNEPGTSKTVRFDTGGTGGNTCDTNPERYLDIQTVALDGNRATYNNATSTFTTLTNELRTKLAAPAPGARVNYVVYADRIRKSGASGEADVPQDDSHDPLNGANQGRDGVGQLFAVVYGDPNTQQADFNGLGQGPRRATFLHELSHNLGAVQNSAPNASGAGHCWDEFDIMCYQDGGPGIPAGAFPVAGSLINPVCNTGTEFDFSELYDCNRNDYFNPSPVGGSYLATHWNTFDSVFNCSQVNCDAALTPPPAITFGTTHVNGRLSFTVTPANGSITHYEWDVDGDNFYDVDTGTTPSITPDFGDVVPRTVRVRASKADGTYAFDSALVTPTVPTPHFSISGKFQVGETLQLDGGGTTDPDGLITKFLWDLDGDGTYESDTGLNRTTSTVFNAPGSVSVGLEVDFPLGFSQSRTSNFTIAPAAPATAPPPATVVTPTTIAGPSFAAAKVKLGKLISSGLPLSVTCGASCTVSFTLSVDAKTAKKLKLKGKKGKPVVIGKLTGTFAKGTTRPSLKLTRAAKKALKKTKSLKAKLAGSVKQAPGTPLNVSKTLTFKR